MINDLVIPKQGFDDFFIHDELKDNLSLQHKDLLKTMKAYNDDGQNFFLYLHYSNIHTGIMNDVLKVYDNFSKEFFDNKENNEKRYDMLFTDAEKYIKSIII